LQGVSAILFVFILAVGLNLAAGDLSASRWYVEKISALTIGAFGVYVIFRALQNLLPGKQSDSRLTPAHQHDASCGCGHHGVGTTCRAPTGRHALAWCWPSAPGPAAGRS
jgi:ABC-type nickel/cobalt efflux system permease component RcnA